MSIRHLVHPVWLKKSMLCTAFYLFYKIRWIKVPFDYNLLFWDKYVFGFKFPKSRRKEIQKSKKSR